MNEKTAYVTIKGSDVDLSGLDAEEMRLVERLRQQAEARADWNAFDNFWMAEVAAFYDARLHSGADDSDGPVANQQPARVVVGHGLGLGAAAVRPRDEDRRTPLPRPPTTRPRVASGG
jgi:hypothetical protein